MMKMKTLFLRDMKVLYSSALIIILNFTVLSAQTFKLNSVSDLKRVFEDGYNLPSFQDTIKLFGLRGEVISGQCVVQTRKKLTQVSARLSDLTDQKSGTVFPANDVEWNFVGSIPLTENTPNQPLTTVVRKAPGRFPDYLMSEKQIDMHSEPGTTLTGQLS